MSVCVCVCVAGKPINGIQSVGGLKDGRADGRCRARYSRSIIYVTY